ncbi:MAG: hypothetical protein Q9218_008210, partial [Villophora microphyllina]
MSRRVRPVKAKYKRCKYCSEFLQQLGQKFCYATCHNSFRQKQKRDAKELKKLRELGYFICRRARCSAPCKQAQEEREAKKGAAMKQANKRAYEAAVAASFGTNNDQEHTGSEFEIKTEDDRDVREKQYDSNGMAPPLDLQYGKQRDDHDLSGDRVNPLDGKQAFEGQSDSDSDEEMTPYEREQARIDTEESEEEAIRRALKSTNLKRKINIGDYSPDSSEDSDDFSEDGRDGWKAKEIRDFNKSDWENYWESDVELSPTTVARSVSHNAFSTTGLSDYFHPPIDICITCKKVLEDVRKTKYCSNECQRKQCKKRKAIRVVYEAAKAATKPGDPGPDLTPHLSVFAKSLKNPDDEIELACKLQEMVGVPCDPEAMRAEFEKDRGNEHQFPTASWSAIGTHGGNTLNDTTVFQCLDNMQLTEDQQKLAWVWQKRRENINTRAMDYMRRCMAKMVEDRRLGIASDWTEHEESSPETANLKAKLDTKS